LSSNVKSNFATTILLAWERKLDISSLVSEASALQEEGLAPLAAVLYETWLKRNQTPQNQFAYFNLGVILFSEGDLPGAENAYERAIALAPRFLQPRFNLGLVYERQGKEPAALEQWRWIAQNASPERPENHSILIPALNNLARIQETNKQYQEALECLNKSLAIDPKQPDVLHHWVFIREKQCAWPVYTPIKGVSPELIRKCTSALAMLSLSDDPEEQLAAARNYVARKLAMNFPPLSPPRGYGHKKIRIAYSSSDFCLHPVAMLTAELFELHDRESFEVYGFCWSREDGSGIRNRIINAMDHFIRIDKFDDETAAKLIREHEIDILIDLHGQTRGARANLLAYRPAPIQITYLGLPATTGLPCVDYVIADHFLIPDEFAKYYSEKPLYMPDVYQVSDRQRVSSPTPSRESCGLPTDAFVFCSFNNNYKYTPEVFTAWMNILRALPESVLWLLSDNPWAEANLKREAEARGINPERLIFATRVLPEDYLGRYAVADLFLDSFPFNAGTTANDALWMGLPVLTLSGKSFASRMAGALLTAAGLDELITYNLRDYEEKAIALASTPKECKRLRKKLSTVRKSGKLFDTPRFVRNLEKSLKKLVSNL